MCNGRLDTESENSSREDINKNFEETNSDTGMQQVNEQSDTEYAAEDPYSACGFYPWNIEDFIKVKDALDEKISEQPKVSKKVEGERSKICLNCQPCQVIHGKFHSKKSAVHSEILLYQCSYCPQKETYLGSLTEFDKKKMALQNPQVNKLVENGFEYCKFCQFVCDDKERFHEHYHRVHPLM